VIAAFNPTWDLNPGQPSPSIANVAPLTDAADARGHFARLHGRQHSDVSSKVRIEGEQKFDGVFNALKFGFSGSRREKGRYMRRHSLGVLICGVITR